MLCLLLCVRDRGWVKCLCALGSGRSSVGIGGGSGDVVGGGSGDVVASIAGVVVADQLSGLAVHKLAL